MNIVKFIFVKVHVSNNGRDINLYFVFSMYKALVYVMNEIYWNIKKLKNTNIMIALSFLCDNYKQKNGGPHEKLL